MPRIFDNIEKTLLPAIQETLETSHRADFCVGFLNLRGWKTIDSKIEQLAGGEDNCCRLLVGMHRLPHETLRELVGALSDELIDNATLLRLKKRIAEEFREQLMIGTPSNDDEAGLQRFAEQMKQGKVVVKLFLKHNLHAKLYLMFRQDPVSPKVAFLGSSNLTLAGMKHQGELNIDVLEQDGCEKLSKWFNDRWDDRCCVDITKELIAVIEESWARPIPIPPYHIYLKFAWHLSRDARTGINESRMPPEFAGKLFEFQEAAVQLAAHHLDRRRGVLIGDVVGLGKTIMATAVARMREIQTGVSTLVICPKNLVEMWESYCREYGVHAMVVPISQVEKLLPTVPARFRQVLIDESHNLRNRDGQRYQIIEEYIRLSGSHVILLSATPYNRTKLDLSNQLRLFLDEDQDLGIRPEAFIREEGITELRGVSPRTIQAFEKSDYIDDWRELMSKYLVRRTRSFIKDNYAEIECQCGELIRAIETECSACGKSRDPEAKKFLTFPDGTRSYFPVRTPRTARFRCDPNDNDDQYAQLFSDQVVETINHMMLPRYGLGNYIDDQGTTQPTASEAQIIADLSRAGRRLMGFCKTGLFKRLESSGHAFLLSVQRHILRNFIYIHAIENGLPTPIGSQDASLLDSRFTDEDNSLFSSEDDETEDEGNNGIPTEDDFRQRAGEIYNIFTTKARGRFRWINSELFSEELVNDLQSDNDALMGILNDCGVWEPSRDEKLKKLHRMLTRKHQGQKVLIFSQFADTVTYLVEQLKALGVDNIAAVTGGTDNPTKLAKRFSPVSNKCRVQVTPEQELNVLIATDVLSEGQNLQDSAVVVNFDLPWAIIRLIQRAGRVDRIGQNAEEIICHTFLPAQGVEDIINLRGRVRQRLRENSEVIGSDESFFDDDRNNQAVRDLFTEKSGILDGEQDQEIDLNSRAYQIWKNAIEQNPDLKRIIPDLPEVVYSTKPHMPVKGSPEGVLSYIKTSEGNDALVWLDKKGKVVSESQLSILFAAACEPETPAVDRLENHHELVQQSVTIISEEEKTNSTGLGNPRGARFKTYERLKRYLDEIKGTLFDSRQLRLAVEEVYNYPLKSAAARVINHQLKTGITDEQLGNLIVELREENRLSVIHEEEETVEPRIICSMGLAEQTEAK